MSLKELGTPPATPPAGYVRLYGANDGKLRSINASGEEHGLGTDEDSFGVAIKGGATAITTGFKALYRVKKKMRITAFRIDSYDENGAPQVTSGGDFQMALYRNGGGTSEGVFNLATGLDTTSSAMVGWSNVDFVKDDALTFVVESTGSVKNVIVTVYFVSM